MQLGDKIATKLGAYIELLPVGDYGFIIRDAVVEDLPSTDMEKKIILTFEVLDGEHHGKQLREIFFLSDTVRYGEDYRRLARLCNACGIHRTIHDTDELIGRRFIGTVTEDQRITNVFPVVLVE